MSCGVEEGPGHDVGEAAGIGDTVDVGEDVLNAGPEEEKAKAVHVAALKENELKENEVRKRASAERYKQLSKEQAEKLAAKELKLDPKEYNREKLRQQAAAEERRRNLMRENIKQKSARNSDLALKLVIVVWIVIVLGIFYHVYSTIQLGRVSHSFRQGAHFSSARSS